MFHYGYPSKFLKLETYEFGHYLAVLIVIT